LWRISKHTFMFKRFFRKSGRLWDNVKKYGTTGQATDDIIRCMRNACWITTATDKLRIYDTYCFSTAKMVRRTRHNVTFIHKLPVLCKLFLFILLYGLYLVSMDFRFLNKKQALCFIFLRVTNYLCLPRTYYLNVVHSVHWQHVFYLQTNTCTYWTKNNKISTPHRCWGDLF
jgi:hypothetical protein